MPVPAVPAATHFGALPGGQTVEAYRLSNPLGMSVTVLTYGGIVQTIEVPDLRGERRNVALGFARLEDYLVRSPYFGAIIGRVANRIAAGRFQIDGVTHSVPLNLPVRLDRAVTTGAFAVAGRGDWEGLPSRAELSLLDHAPGTAVR